MGIIIGLSSIIPGGSILLAGPFALGSALYFLRISRDEQVELGNMFDGFKKFGNALGAYLLMCIIVFLGIILFIIPGIKAALALSQTFSIMHDEPNLGPIEAMKKNHEIMKGHRGYYFLLNLSFIGWALLSIFTLFIGLFYLASYVATTNSIFYNNLVDHQNKDIKELGSHLETL